ncbi:MAG TPA: protein kinase [Vicinamibacterales bacterium]|nr:protein kinase [Vicinamibacterales bacterium]
MRYDLHPHAIQPMLAAGVKLGPYEIQAAIGSGGMGDVYRALDTRLDRIVAIKVLPTHIASDPHVRERFHREARTISQLSNSQICALHDIGDTVVSDGASTAEPVSFLVLEYLEGQTLAERLRHGPLRVAEALEMTRLRHCGARARSPAWRRRGNRHRADR